MTQAFNLSQLANNLDSSGRLDATDGLVNAVPIANGGTGASSIAAAVSNLSASIYPVGSIYINAAVSTNPGTLLGFGTWVSFGTGRVLIGVDVSDSAFDILGKTGGSKDATLVSHSHTFSGNTGGQSADHTHNITYDNRGDAFGGSPSMSITPGSSSRSTTGTSNDHVHGFSGTTNTQGSSATNANLPPYITVYMWKRTA